MIKYSSSLNIRIDNITAKKPANKQCHKIKCMQKTIIILNIECIIKKVLSEKKEKKEKATNVRRRLKKKKKNRIWIKFLQKSIYIYT